MKNSRERIKKLIVQALLVVMATGCINLNPVKVSSETKEEGNSLLSKDLDGDGLKDGLEEVFRADSRKVDTDGDGLYDFTEIKLGLDPAKDDSDNNGIYDSSEDYDNDGLTNLEEVSLGTDLTQKDTDGDGLSDFEEVKVYKTSPVISDTDGDGLFDGDEVKLNLDPNKSSSDGVTKDSERMIEQTLSSNRISEVALEGECEFKPTLSGMVKDSLDRNVFINSYDTTPLMDIKGVVGEGINIDSKYKDNEELTLSFDYTNYLKNNDEDRVNNMEICHYENNSFTILDTINDKENKCLTTKINKPGIYFMINKEDALQSKRKRDNKTGLSTNKLFRGTSSSSKDSDYDGIEDSVDTAPNNNNFTGNLKTGFATSKVSYIMDYRNFFATTKKYNSSIATISSLFSSVIYNGSSYDGMNLTKFMTKHGIKDVNDYNLASMYTDSDVSEAYIGHRKVTYNGVTKEIIVVVVKGTNGTIKEWESNFDIGSTINKSKFSDWTITSNHKGFDVAATRILKCITDYESKSYLDKSAKKAYWVTGHSRGAGIANILGARLVDASKDVYCYTFAAPNTTTASNATNTTTYAGIYNVLNKDDFVPYLPVTAWGFKHYGKSYTISIDENYEKEWESLTGIGDYNPDTLGMEKTLNAISKIISNRNDAYVLSCRCHGNGSNDKITIKNRGTSKESREKAIAKIPSNSIPYCKITRYNGTGIVGWDFTVCQQPEYFMQLLAAFMAKKIDAYRFGVELNIADRYEAAKSGIVRSGLGGLEHPHYTESYYLLSKHI